MSADPSLSRRGGRVPLVLALVLGAALLAALVVWLRSRPAVQDGGPAPEQGAEAQVQRLRELAAAYFADDSRAKARETLALLVERKRPDPADLIAAAIVELSEVRTDTARTLLERARELGDRSPQLDYNLARVAFYEADFARAAQLLREVRSRQPDDVPLALLLGQVVEEVALSGVGDTREAEQIYRQVVTRGEAAGPPWYRMAVYRLAQLLSRGGREDEAAQYFDQIDRLEERGVRAPTPAQAEQGNLGRLIPPPPSGNHPAGPGALPTFETSAQVLPSLAAAAGVQAADLDDDCRVDLVAWGPQGLAVALQSDGFIWTPRALAEGPVDAAVAFDLDNAADGGLDLLHAQGAKVSLLRSFRRDPADPTQKLGALDWRAWDRTLPALPAAPHAIVAVDYDHEGDLDLVLVGEFGARLWRNDGAGEPDPAGVFTDATTESGLPTDRAFSWCVPEDYDGDQDVDLLFGGAESAYLADNLRGGRFGDASERLGAVGALRGQPLVADLDGDGRPDLWHGDSLLVGGALGRFQPRPLGAEPASALPAEARLHTADIDLDGSLDVFWVDGSLLRGRLSVGLEMTRAFELDPQASSALGQALLFDLDGDLAHDLVLAGASALEIRRGAQRGSALRLFYRGQKDNRQAIGAVIEVRAGTVYRRIFARGAPELIGLGSAPEVDYTRIRWPNGVLQLDMRHALGDRACDTASTEAFQPEGLQGSCPFLYSWNGQHYEFVSDVLGITPLGLPMAPGMLVPPDHDEYVLVRAEQLAPRDGVYELHFTEELREVTYLDRIRLDVVDHPAGTEIYPNELFCFPPFPAATIHTVAAPLRPTRATDAEGRDWTQALAAIDAAHAVPFEPAPGQMLGLATPHYLELEFDRDAVAAASKLRLLMTGWFYWTDASVNMAAARDPRFDFVPPILQVPDGMGGWRPLGPPVGFPAGKTKTMVVDLTDALDRSDPRLRVFTTLRLYWDSIRLAVDADTTPLAKHSLEPASAQLWRRGFSAPLRDGRANQPERFVWEELAEFPRWNPHPGRYTRLGECLPLVEAIDDMFVIMASGDALTVRFDATALPPVPQGWRRDFLVFLDGWAKDRDPNTLEALYVEPLPFHGMSAYPYGEGERFPDGEAHRRWRREWNTREAEPWIPFQAPKDSPQLAIPQR